jgi:hypothetical protein
MRGPKENYNAEVVLSRLEAMIERGCPRQISQVYGELSIFDWWPERLSLAHMKQMRTFLKEAIKLGYTGYVCFKVGASGCANGMWAHKEEGKAKGEDVYSPDGDAIYRSFTPDYTYYSFRKNDKWMPGEDTDGKPYDSLKTPKMLERALASA